ncbi:hypothetical protein P7M24_25380, partial [Vibrio parahaemolyticus]|nr:hypothetical protein [Vibrio parahaemolyticus]
NTNDKKTKARKQLFYTHGNHLPLIKTFVFRIAIVYALTSFMEVVIFFSYSYQKYSFVIL